MKRLNTILIILLLALMFAILASTSFAATKYFTTKENVPVWSASSSNSTLVYRIPKIGTLVDVVQSTTNSSGNLWYKLSNGRYIYSGNVSKCVSTLSISQLPSTIKYFSGGTPSECFSATITSNYNIRSVELTISGWGLCVSPNAKTLNVGSLFTNYKFSNLSPGKYNYTITARDIIGKTVSKTSSFTVLSPNFKLSNLSKLTECKTQSQYPVGSNERDACASFSLSHCRTLIDNVANTTPQNFWKPGTYLTVWSLGNYTASNAGVYNQQTVLTKALNELLNNRPTVLHVYYKSKGSNTEHWVSIVGYRNVTSKNNLTTTNFIAIDPWDGKEVVLSDVFAIKSDFRIAYSAQ